METLLSLILLACFHNKLPSYANQQIEKAKQNIVLKVSRVRTLKGQITSMVKII